MSVAQPNAVVQVAAHSSVSPIRVRKRWKEKWTVTSRETTRVWHVEWPEVRLDRSSWPKTDHRNLLSGLRV